MINVQDAMMVGGLLMCLGLFAGFVIGVAIQGTEAAFGRFHLRLAKERAEADLITQSWVSRSVALERTRTDKQPALDVAGTLASAIKDIEDLNDQGVDDIDDGEETGTIRIFGEDDEPGEPCSFECDDCRDERISDELALCQEAMTDKDTDVSDRHLYYAVQQALEWAVDPDQFASPFDVIQEGNCYYSPSSPGAEPANEQ